jgi:ABC-type phosphate transport system permease subunit
MTDQTTTPLISGLNQDRKALRDVVSANIAKRHAKEMRFRAFGIAMVMTAVLSACLLVVSILLQSIPALSEHRLQKPIRLAIATRWKSVRVAILQGLCRMA